MKIQSLAIIFIIIIMPITIVLSEFVNNKITTAKKEIEYNSKIFNSASDTLKAFQLNNVNNAYNDIGTKKVEDIEAAANTFLNSLNTNFGFSGYKSDIMKDYIPAIVFTLYDGYYVYAPFINTLTTTLNSDGEPELKSGSPYRNEDQNLDRENVAEEYENGKKLYGLRPYVYYNCRYKIDDENDFIITYTLDNYITIQGIVEGDYVYEYGYLDKNISISASSETDNYDKYGKHIYNVYRYNNVAFTQDSTELLEEYVGNDLYPYVKINGVKYYYENYDKSETLENNIEFGPKVFYIDNKGTRKYEQYNTSGENLVKAIIGNKSGYEYCKDSYSFTKWVEEKLNGLTVNYAIDSTTGNPLESVLGSDSKIFGNDNDYVNPNSNFEQHRKEVIRNVIETNLSRAISAFSSNANIEFIMPKVSEDDWERIENNVCIIGFVQGFNLGFKKYNGYTVVTKEYVDEDDIYLLDDGKYYYKPNDINLTNGTVTTSSLVGIWKIDFERKKCLNDDGTEISYYPHNEPGSYSSIVGSSGLKNMIGILNQYKNMYEYINSSLASDTLKTAFYKALARERYGAYHVDNNQDLKYFLDQYN